MTLSHFSTMRLIGTPSAVAALKMRAPVAYPLWLLPASQTMPEAVRTVHMELQVVVARDGGHRIDVLQRQYLATLAVVRRLQSNHARLREVGVVLTDAVLDLLQVDGAVRPVGQRAWVGASQRCRSTCSDSPSMRTLM